MQRFIADAVEFMPILLQGVKFTILITVGSLALSTVLGLVWALMRVSGIRILAGIQIVIINFIRGIPIIVQLFYIYFVLPDLGITLSALQAGIIGLGIAYSAYQAENFRAGIEAIDHGQVEAAQSLGMGWVLMMRRVILPQAVQDRAAALWEHHDHDAEGFLAGLDHHGRRARLAGKADRLVDVQERRPSSRWWRCSICA